MFSRKKAQDTQKDCDYFLPKAFESENSHTRLFLKERLFVGWYYLTLRASDRVFFGSIFQYSSGSVSGEFSRTAL